MSAKDAAERFECCVCEDGGGCEFCPKVIRLPIPAPAQPQAQRRYTVTVIHGFTTPEGAQDFFEFVSSRLDPRDDVTAMIDRVGDVA